MYEILISVYRVNNFASKQWVYGANRNATNGKFGIFSTTFPKISHVGHVSFPTCQNLILVLESIKKYVNIKVLIFFFSFFLQND